MIEITYPTCNIKYTSHAAPVHSVPMTTTFISLGVKTIIPTVHTLLPVYAYSPHGTICDCDSRNTSANISKRWCVWRKQLGPLCMTYHSLVCPSPVLNFTRPFIKLTTNCDNKLLQQCPTCIRDWLQVKATNLTESRLTYSVLTQNNINVHHS